MPLDFIPDAPPAPAAPVLDFQPDQPVLDFKPDAQALDFQPDTQTQTTPQPSPARQAQIEANRRLVQGNNEPFFTRLAKSIGGEDFSPSDEGTPVAQQIEAANQPLVNLPPMPKDYGLSPGMASMLKGYSPVGYELPAALYNEAKAIPEFLSKPGALATLGLGASEPVVARLISGGFTADMLIQAKEAAKEAGMNWDSMEFKDKVAFVVHMAATGAFASSTALHAKGAPAEADLSNVKPSPPLQLTPEDLATLKSGMEFNPSKPVIRESQIAQPPPPNEAPNAETPSQPAAAEAIRPAAVPGNAPNSIPEAPRPAEATGAPGSSPVGQANETPVPAGQAAVAGGEVAANVESKVPPVEPPNPAKTAEPLDFVPQSEQVGADEGPKAETQTPPAQPEPTASGGDSGAGNRVQADRGPLGPPVPKSPKDLISSVGEIEPLEKGPSPDSTPEAVEKVQEQVARVPMRDAKETKADILDKVQKAITEAPSEDDLGVSTSWKRKISDDKMSDVDYTAYNKEREEKGATKITIDIPGDGTFTVWNTKESLGKMLDRAKKIKTASAFPEPKASYPTAEQGKVWTKEADLLARSDTEKDVDPNTRELTPEPTTKLRPSDYGDEKMEPGQFVSDGRIGLDTQFINEKDLARLRKSNLTKQHSPAKQSGMESLIKHGLENNKTELVRVGYRTGESGMELAYYVDPETGQYWAFPRAQETMIEKWVKGDGDPSFFADAKDKNGNLIVRKGGNDVGIIRPIERNEKNAIDVPTAITRSQPPKPEPPATSEEPLSMGPGAASPEQLRKARIMAIDDAMREPEESPERQKFNQKASALWPDADPADIEELWKDYQAARESIKASGGPKPMSVAAGEVTGEIPKPVPGSEKFPTALKNATTDDELEAMGKPRTMAPARESNPERWDKSMRMMDEDPTLQDRVIRELDADPRRVVTANEGDMLLQRKVDLKNQRNKVTAQGQAAAKAGDAEGILKAKTDSAKLEDEIAHLALLTRRAGSAQARAFQARKMGVAADYSIDDLEQQRLAAKGYEPLTEADRQQIEATHKALEENQKAMDELAGQVPKDVQEEIDRQLRQGTAQVKIQSGISPRIMDAAKSIVAKLDARADAARVRLRSKLQRTSAAVDPTILLDVAEIGASHLAHAALDFAQWSAKIIEEFGDPVKPYLDEGYKAAQKIIDDQAAKSGKVDAPKVKAAIQGSDLSEKITRAQEAIKSKIETAQADPDPLRKSEISPLVQKLARMIVERDKLGIGDRETLIDKIHEELKAFLPEMTRREAAEALSGYGEYTTPAQDWVSKTIRSIKSQTQKVLGIEDILKTGQAEKTGPQRDEMDQPNRALEKKRNEAKKEAARLGLVTQDPGAALKSYLGSKETRLKNRISDLKQEIADGKLAVKQGAPNATNAKIEALEAELKDVTDQHKAIFGKDMDDAAKLRAAEAMAERNEVEWNDKLARAKRGDFGPEPVAPKQQSAKLDAIRARTEAIKAERDALKKLANPKATPEEIAIKTQITRLKNRNADLMDRLAAGDFAPRPRKAPVRNAELDRLQQEQNGIKLAFDRGSAQARYDSMTKTEKFTDLAVKLRRASLLSGPGTLLKLGGAAALRMGTALPRAVIGAGLDRILPSVSEHAQFESGANVKAEAAAWRGFFTKGMKDAGDALRMRESALDLQYGKLDTAPRSLLNYFGYLHQAIKAPVMRAAFERAYEKGMEYEIRNGANPADALVQQRVGMGAYKEGLRAIFKQNNAISSAVDAGIRTLENKGHTTLATGARLALPIKTVPLNIMGEVLEHTFGTATGSVRLAKAYRAGFENLKPEEADIIMRQLKNGMIGNAAIALGFLAPQMFGGFFQPKEKREASDVQYGRARIGGMDIPQTFLHNPLVVAAQMASTVRRVADEKFKKSDTDNKGVLEGLLSASEGLAYETPIFHEMVAGMGEASAKNRAGTRLGGVARDLVVPQLIQQPAKYFDQPPGQFNPWMPNTVRRQPTNFSEAFKTGIPGARQTVPAK